MSYGSFKNCYRESIRLQIIYIIYVCEQNLALDNLQELSYHKTQPSNQPTNLIPTTNTL